MASRWDDTLTDMIVDARVDGLSEERVREIVESALASVAVE